MNYYNNYTQELQAMRDRIDRQLQQYQQMQQQPMQQPITQNFQIAPQNNVGELEGRYAQSIDDVKNTFVLKTGIFINKDHTNLWIKDVSGNIKTYKLEEVVELDEKDKMIVELQKQINELKEEVLNANESINANVDEPITEQKPTKIPTRTKSNSK